MGIVQLGYHGSMETIREAAENNWKSISERLVQAIEEERENTMPPENKKQGKETKKQEEQIRYPPERKRRNVQHRKEKKNSATPKEKKRSNTTQLQEKKKA